jgi:hypothetical protein
VIGVTGAITIALAPTSAIPVVNHGRIEASLIEASMCNPNPEKSGKTTGGTLARGAPRR